jgi:hypothetical protein
VRCIAFLIVMSADSLPAMIAGALLCGVGSALFTPAALAGLPRMMDRDDARAAALGLFGAIDDIGLTAGPALAAVLLAIIAPSTLMGLNAVTFAISAVLIVSLAIGGATRGPRTTSLLADARAGVATSPPARRSAPCSSPRPASCSASGSRTSARWCSPARSSKSAARAWR